MQTESPAQIQAPPRLPDFDEAPALDCYGWLKEATFAHAPGGRGSSINESLRVVNFNVAPGVPCSTSFRLALLRKILQTSVTQSVTVLLLPAGFFGFHFKPDESWDWNWDWDISPDMLKEELSALATACPSSFMFAVGVDVTGDDQRQWWFQGGVGFYREIQRAGALRPKTAIEGRIIHHADFALLGFVCGECYEWHEDELIGALQKHHVDVVAVSAHKKVNRVASPEVPEDYKRWAFQRRFQLLSRYCGAALAQARGLDAQLVRNCDNWFVHQGELPFPGSSEGTPLRFVSDKNEAVSS